MTLGTPPTPRAIGLVGLCAVMWGLYWVPILILESRGLSGPFASLFLAAASAVIAFPFWLVSKNRIPEWRSLLGAVGVGAAFSLYGIAISYSDVVRVVLLFYLAPAWSTLIECLFFKRRWSWQSLLGIAFSFVGIVVLFRGELPVEGLGAVGDWMALLAGICWSAGSALMFSAKRMDIKNLLFASFVMAGVISLAIVFFLGDVAYPDNTNNLNHLLKTAVICILFGIVYLYPMTYITLWGATRIPPATMSFLLTLEVVAAVASSAWFLGLRFGLIEFIGTCLIISGALVEVLRSRHQPVAAT